MARSENVASGAGISGRRAGITLWAIMALALALRLFRLGGQSFWWDEVYSATLSAQDLATIIPRFGQTPTLYHVLLHFWMYLGQSDTVIRLMSVLFGVVAVWVMYRLGTILFDVRHGLMCAFLLAISPFHIWYSQEARMYTLLILLSAASVLYFVRFLQESKGRFLIGWILTIILAVYTHYYAVFILLFQVIYFIIYRGTYRILWKRFYSALGLLAILGIPILIILFFSQRFSELCAVGAGGNPLQPFSIPYTFFAFSLGFSYGPSIAELHRFISLRTVWPYLPQIVPAILLFAGIFALGVWHLWRGQQGKKLMFLSLYLLVPLFGAGLTSLFWAKLSYNVRYVSVALPAYILFLSVGILSRNRKMVRWALVILTLGFVSVSIWNNYFQGRYAKEDYRSATEFISRYSQEGDVILVTHIMPFKYYYHGPLPARSFFWSPTFYRRILAVQLHGYRRSWFVLSREWGSDPQGKLSEYMKNTFPAVRETTFANLSLGLYDLTTNQVVRKPIR